MNKALLCMLGLVSLLISRASFAESSRSQLTLASFNLHTEQLLEVPKYWYFRAPAVLQTLKSLDAELIQLQEVPVTRQQQLRDTMLGFQYIEGPGGLASLVREDRWSVLRSQTLALDTQVSAHALTLVEKSQSEARPLTVWNIWMDLEANQAPLLAAQLEQLLQKHSSHEPDAITLSVKAPDDLRHEKKSLQQILHLFGLRQADPQSFAITTNGWWATKWTTQDWHDAVFAKSTWKLAEAQLIRQKIRGSYPSTHFPLQTRYLPTGELMADTTAVIPAPPSFSSESKASFWHKEVYPAGQPTGHAR